MRPHARRQRRGHRHGHDEEHRVCVREGAPDRLARGVRHRACPPLRRLRRGRSAIIDISEHAWLPVPTDAGPAPDAFNRAGDLTRIAHVEIDRSGRHGRVRVDDLTVMKTTKSASPGSTAIGTRRCRGRGPHDGHEDACDLGLPSGPCRRRSLDFEVAWDGAAARRSGIRSPSTSARRSRLDLIMAAAMMDRRAVYRLGAHGPTELHHWLVDLSKFGLDNPGEVFVPRPSRTPVRRDHPPAIGRLAGAGVLKGRAPAGVEVLVRRCPAPTRSSCPTRSHSWPRSPPVRPTRQELLARRRARQPRSMAREPRIAGRDRVVRLDPVGGSSSRRPT